VHYRQVLQYSNTSVNNVNGSGISVLKACPPNQ
jgi:hypothetical protein